MRDNSQQKRHNRGANRPQHGSHSKVTRAPERSDNASKGGASNAGKYRGPRWYALVVPSNESGNTALGFLDDFGYQTLFDPDLPKNIQIKDISKKAGDDATFAMIPASLVDVGLMKEEWSSFSRVGTPETMILVGMTKQSGALKVLKTQEFLST